MEPKSSTRTESRAESVFSADHSDNAGCPRCGSADVEWALCNACGWEQGDAR
jgi:hypothetical protein